MRLANPDQSSFKILHFCIEFDIRYCATKSNLVKVFTRGKEDNSPSLLNCSCKFCCVKYVVVDFISDLLKNFFNNRKVFMGVSPVDVFPNYIFGLFKLNDLCKIIEQFRFNTFKAL